MKYLLPRFVRSSLALSLCVLSLTGILAPAGAHAFGSLAENGTAQFMGIGIAPQKILHVSGSGPGSVPLFSRASDSAGFIIERTPTNRWVLGVNESPTLGNGFVLSTIPVGTTSVPRLMINQNGSVGINTTSPNVLAMLDVVNENTTAGHAAIFGQTPGGVTMGVVGLNWGALTGGYLGGVTGSIPAGAYGAYYSDNGTPRNVGILGGTQFGAFGGNNGTKTMGMLGYATAGVYGSNSDNYSCYAGEFDGNVWMHDNLQVSNYIYCKGIFATDNKSFVADYPGDPSKQIVYTCLEGPEAGTYVRGSAELKGGEAVVTLPDHFAIVTAGSGLTVQLTPSGRWLQLYVVEKSPSRIVVREASGQDGSFDYLVQGIRSGYEDYRAVRDRIPALPVQTKSGPAGEKPGSGLLRELTRAGPQFGK